MSCGMAGIAGTVMVIYATILGPVIPNALGTVISGRGDQHARRAGGLGADGAVRAGHAVGGHRRATVDRPATLGSLDALVRGTADGIGPLVGITTTLLVAVAHW